MTSGHGTLRVTGTGMVQVAPDEAVVHLGINTEGKTAGDAVGSNAKATQAVLDAVSAEPNHGVTTTGLGVSPIMSYDPDTGVGHVVGFRATNGVQVKTKTGYAGQIYDAGIKAGANESSGITFRIQNEAPHREAALKLAVEVAHQEAKLVAQAANVQLDGTDSIQIDASGGRMVYRTEAVDSKSMPTPVIPQDKTITASVQIQFRTRG